MGSDVDARRHELASDMVCGVTRRSNLAKRCAALQQLSTWARIANTSRGPAPTRADAMYRYVAIMSLDVNYADVTSSTDRGNMKLEKSRSFVKRFVRQWQLKRASIKARLILTQGEVRIEVPLPVVSTGLS